ncbi:MULTISPECIES: Rossmann-like domain-containing protein [Clostridium]|uniref:Membrane protein n=1 Tax=Clostridium haemolyticum NCTC 9693 TaxID=1443114 RepID=A0ABR4TBE9_CLOHA|nr:MULTISPECIES: DUF364 domain-containing protein [Clostridium]KEI14422.1 membrane protein [Clostridium haemolyticum NCTC 9693]KGM98674.1 membrane protein [Clostridium haemolyticum NCTC 8350]MCD3246058.1 hypothetical protein [Clostridium botulinum C]MCD3262556.1 hypothetical protein [Clostridium botulinum C]CAG7839372.1 hypothetical protein CLOHAE12215_00782 [Clostridium haemolyticum]
MNNCDFYEKLLKKFRKVVEENDLLNEEVNINGRTLTPKEAIGTPVRQDYPIIKGKEKLIQAEFKGEKGQAFTDMPGEFSGTISEIINKPIKTNFDMAILISTLNAVCKYLKITDKSIHCKDEDPEECAKKLVEYIKEKYGHPKIALIGLQPAMLQRLSENFDVRVVDLNKEKIGKVKFGIKIENAEEKTKDLLKWCDVIMATGSTVANNTIRNFLNEKPVIFFGTTIAGTAELMNLPRFCPCSN